MQFKSTETWGFHHALRGMRNPLNSWEKSDSNWEEGIIGSSDLRLARSLIKAGPEHRKFLRQIFVSVDITAPLYWWKEFDTYKVGTVANSTSTMHKLLSRPIDMGCFERGDYADLPLKELITTNDFIEWQLIPFLEDLRKKAIDEKDKGHDYSSKAYWKELVRWLPESWLQTRTITMNYENLLSIYNQRKNHKLKEWKDDFCNWVKTLPYAKDFILGED